MALDQHFRDAGGESEVRIYLEGGVVAEKVGQGALADERMYMMERGVPIVQAGEVVDDHRPAPTGVAAAVLQPPFECLLRRFEQVRLIRRDQFERVEAE